MFSRVPENPRLRNAMNNWTFATVTYTLVVNLTDPGLFIALVFVKSVTWRKLCSMGLGGMEMLPELPNT